MHDFEYENNSKKTQYSQTTKQKYLESFTAICITPTLDYSCGKLRQASKQAKKKQKTSKQNTYKYRKTC